MIRLFQTHKVREQMELEGMWEFTTVCNDVLPESYKYSLPVPGCWEQHPDLLTYRGRGAYRKTIHIQEECCLRLEFKGVSHTADVYFDGRPVAHHYNAYTPFAAVIPDVKEGEHELVVMVDNSFSGKSALHIGNDYYTYGGIIRPVAVEKLEHAFIERMEFSPFPAEGIWNANIKVFIRSVARTELYINVKGKLGVQELYFGDIAVKAGENEVISKVFSFEGIEFWSNENPKLYFLEACLYVNEKSTPCDDLIERVGFRTVSIDRRKLKLNGEGILLKGFNRHEDYAVVGCAIPLQLMVKDMDLMRDMGVNAVRTCHYPNDERFIDLCDECGIFVWEENHARGLNLEQMKNPNFEKQCEDCNREMVQNHFNHPSIIIWGILNECASNTVEGRRMYKKQFEQIRLMDSGRLLTFASCQHFKDICLDLADIISLNIYSGWYNEDDVAEAYEKELQWVENSGGAGKPVIISELGAAAIYGFREPTRVKWSEERQMDILERCLSFYLHRPEIRGTFIWQFSDCRVTEENDWYRSRARTKNNKGVVDEYRRPKLVYDTVKKHYSDIGGIIAVTKL